MCVCVSCGSLPWMEAGFEWFTAPFRIAALCVIENISLSHWWFVVAQMLDKIYFLPLCASFIVRYKSSHDE